MSSTKELPINSELVDSVKEFSSPFITPGDDDIYLSHLKGINYDFLEQERIINNYYLQYLSKFKPTDINLILLKERQIYNTNRLCPCQQGFQTWVFS